MPGEAGQAAGRPLTLRHAALHGETLRPVFILGKCLEICSWLTVDYTGEASLHKLFKVKLLMGQKTVESRNYLNSPLS